MRSAGQTETTRPGMSPELARTVAAAARATLLNVEAEDLVNTRQYLLAGGSVNVQPMNRFGSGWSGDSQLFWSGGRVGAVLDLLVDIPVAATYALELYLTRAPDYADLKLEVAGQAASRSFSGYAPRLLPPGPQQAGKFVLQAGRQKISFMIVGKYVQAKDYFAGIDRIRLYPVGAP